MDNRKKILTLVYMALYCALFVLLDRISEMISLFKMPSGGKLNLGPIALLVCSYHLGYKKGAIVGLVSVLLQLVIGSVAYYGLLSFVLDYLLAYAVYGLSSLFPNYKFFYSGILITNMVRLMFSTISGVILWQTPLDASFVYNLGYILPTTICAIIIVPILFKSLKPIIERN